MQKINWFDCKLDIYDSDGFAVDITELPAKIRKEIVTAISKGKTCGSFEGEVVDEELIEELHPIYVNQLRDVVAMQQEAVKQREIERQNRIEEMKLLEQQQQVEQKEEQEDE